MKTTSFIASRYLSYSLHNYNLSFLIRICYISITATIAALLIVLAVMTGFEEKITEKLSALQSDLVIYGPFTPARVAEIEKRLARIPQLVSAAGPRLARPVLMKHGSRYTPFSLLGIDKTKEPEFCLLQATTYKTPELPGISGRLRSQEEARSKEKHNALLIGRSCAIAWGLRIGDIIELSIPVERWWGYSLKTRQFEIEGIFQIGVEEYDTNIFCADYGVVAELFDVQVPDRIALFVPRNGAVAAILTRTLPAFSARVALACKSLFATGSTAAELAISLLKHRFSDFSTASWEERYPDLGETFRFEKYLMALLFSLFLLLSFLTITSLITLFLRFKQHDRALLALLGAERSCIEKIFLTIGWQIIWRSLGIAILLAYGICYLITTYEPLSLPGTYYLSALPAMLLPGHVLGVSLFVGILGACGLRAPLFFERKTPLTALLKK